METLLPFALLCFTSFFTLTNPLGTMPVFLTMTHGMTDKQRLKERVCHLDTDTLKRVNYALKISLELIT